MLAKISYTIDLQNNIGYKRYSFLVEAFRNIISLSMSTSFYIVSPHKSKGNNNLMQYIELGIVSIELIKHQIIPLLKSAKRSNLISII